MAKSITILGSTGSIGANTLDVIASCKADYDVKALTAHSNVEKLAQQAIAFNADYAVIGDEALYAALKNALQGSNVMAMAGRQALLDIADYNVDITMAAIVGTAGLEPTLNAIRQGTKVAFASKECLVAAGQFMMREVQNYGTKLLPVDSEHNAIFQVFEADNKASIRRLILTASGGPFREWSADRIAQATPEQAVNHPNWSMGAKISVDSATMMNKALEVIEAKYLFDMPHEQIDVLVHPQSIIHSMVEYADGSILSQMGPSDMRTPIANCLAWPQRMPTSGPLLSLEKMNGLSFEQPDIVKFPALKIVRDVLNAGHAASIIFNAANEVAVDAFLTKRIGFCDIMSLITEALNKINEISIESLEDVVHFDTKCKAESYDILDKICAQAA